MRASRHFPILGRYDIDLMTSITGVHFTKHDATGRAKDRIDAEELRKQKPST
jgi:hypothetical protein